MKRIWLLTMVEQGVTTEALVKFGLMACRESGYARPVPAGQFCKWAWEKAMQASGIPDLATAYRMVCQRLQRPQMSLTGAMYHLWTELDGHVLRSAQHDEIRKMVERAHAQTLADWKNGKPWHQPVEIKPERCLPVLPTSKDQCRKNLQRLMAGL